MKLSSQRTSEIRRGESRQAGRKRELEGRTYPVIRSVVKLVVKR